MASPMTAASRRAATTAAAIWISRMPLVPALVPGDAGAGRRYELPAGGGLLSRLWGDPSGPPDHCPNVASWGSVPHPGPSRRLALVRWTGLEIVAYWERDAKHGIIAKPERPVRPR